MITWQQITDEEWIITSKNKTIRVNGLRSLIAYSMAFGLEMEDIEHARLEMLRNEHDFCEFGYLGSMIYSKRTEVKNVSH